MKEEALLAAVRDLCKLLGLRSYHTHSSIRSDPGFPDLVIVGRRVLYRELKTAVGRLTVEQATWINALRDARQDAEVWRPVDLASGRIKAELVALRPTGIKCERLALRPTGAEATR